MRIALPFVFGCALAACGTTSSMPAGASTQASATASVNAIRAAAGAGAVRRSSQLDLVARAHARDMAANSFFSHTGSNGSSVGQRAKSAGYTWCTVSENIAKGYREQSDAIEGWRNSRGHYRGMVNAKSREFGLANVGEYWVMVLAAKRC